MNTDDEFQSKFPPERLTRRSAFLSLTLVTAIAVSAVCALSRADLIHRYSFATDAAVGGSALDTGSVGGADGMLRNVATVSGGQLQFNNPNFSPASFAGGYLALPPSILPSSGSVTIEQWGTYNGSGFFTEAYAFTDHANDLGSPEVVSNPPGANVGQYLLHAVSAPQPNPLPTPPGGGPPVANTGGSHVAQTTMGYAGGPETDAYGTTPGIGAGGGGGYLDDGGTYMTATVIDGDAGTLSYYLYRVSDGLGGLQQTIAAVPLSSYSFTNAYLGRSPFLADNWLSGSVDEFRIFSDARSANQIAADFGAGPNAVVPEPATLTLVFGALSLLVAARRRGR